ncbi:23853_t:CDS:2, partial [Gigaspora rosea]
VSSQCLNTTCLCPKPPNALPQGQYCGGCDNTHIYECNPQGGICDYGLRSSCAQCGELDCTIPKTTATIATTKATTTIATTTTTATSANIKTSTNIANTATAKTTTTNACASSNKQSLCFKTPSNR